MNEQEAKELLDLRSELQTKASRYEQQGKMELADIYTTLQLIIKFKVNKMYGNAEMIIK